MRGVVKENRVKEAIDHSLFIHLQIGTQSPYMLSVAISCLQLLLSLQAAQQPAYILHPPYFHSVPDLINATSAVIDACSVL